MGKKKTKVTLVHLPTVALRIVGFNDPEFETFFGSAAYLGNVYRKVIPPSLPRVASVMERNMSMDVSILDLRTADYKREEIYKVIEWEDYEIEVARVGSPFNRADQALFSSDWIGISSHFTYESGIVRDFISYAKQLNPLIKVMVGGADVISRPHEYLRFGADLVFIGDFNPHAFESYSGKPKIVPSYRHSFEELITPAFDKLPDISKYDDSHDGPVPDGVRPPIGFIYFTRGCPRECDFCESRRTKFEALSLKCSVAMLEHYRNAGVQTLNFADDNLLLLAARKDTRDHLLELLQIMRDMEFAWEFPNGLEIGRLLEAESIDEELIDALFSHRIVQDTGQIIGAYRTYIPIETFDRRENYKKLKPLVQQNKIIERIASCGLPEIDFGVIIPPDADKDTFTHIEEGYFEIKDIISVYNNTLARYAVFHLIPISLYRSMPTKYSVEEFPEGWNFHFPVYDGLYFTAREMFERKLRLVKKIDQQNYESMKIGQYSYS